MSERAKFWRYCVRVAVGSKHRAIAQKVPHSIDAYFIDELLVDQEWRCAISKVPLKASASRDDTRDPFSPQLDRIIPSLGYVPGNVRVVAKIVNHAMSDWGLEAFVTVAKALAAKEQNSVRTPARRRHISRPRKAEIP